MTVTVAELSFCLTPVRWECAHAVLSFRLEPWFVYCFDAAVCVQIMLMPTKNNNKEKQVGD